MKVCYPYEKRGTKQKDATINAGAGGVLIDRKADLQACMGRKLVNSKGQGAAVVIYVFGGFR